MSLFNDDPFGGMFDLDGDGRTDLNEEFMAYKMFEEVTREDDDGDLSDDDLFDDSGDDPFADDDF